MPLPHLRHIRTIAAWSAIVLAGVLAGWFGQQHRRQQVVEELLDDAKRAAVAFDGIETQRLAGTRADLNTAAYQVVKHRLQSLRAISASIRFVYIFRTVPGTKNVVFLADSATVGAKDESLPGDPYPQASGSPGLQEILRTGQPTTEGPLDDDFGTWITGYALIDEHKAADGATIKEVLGVDIDATHWERDRWIAGIQYGMYVMVLLGLPLGAWLVMRRQIEQQEVIRNLSEAMEQSHSALLICDLESRIEYANRGLCQQIGYSRRELIGRTWREFRVADGADEALGEILATIRAGQTWEGEWSNRRKDGSVYPVRGVVTPVKHRDDSLACFVAVFDDVTEIKRREAELRDARDLAQAGDRAKSQFLATMSHEVRTPLNGIVGFTSLLLDTELAAEQREYVQTIRASGEALIQLTGDILDFARIESGKLKLDAAPCDPRECDEAALDVLATRAAEKKIELLHWFSDELPASVVIDAGRLRQVLSNLIGNAVKFTERGEVKVSVALAATERAETDDRLTLQFTVEDTGIGIAPLQHEKLFKPFTQLDESSTRRYGGTGLGLAICRNLVRLMDGEITCESELGHGSKFSFTIRAAIAVAEPPDHDLSQLRVGLAAATGPLRSELTELLTNWGACLVTVERYQQLKGEEYDVLSSTLGS